jgi:hypothetical protein
MPQVFALGSSSSGPGRLGFLPNSPSEIRTFWEETAYNAVCVLIAAALTTAARMRKVHLEALFIIPAGFLKALKIKKLAAIVGRYGLELLLKVFAKQRSGLSNAHPTALCVLSGRRMMTSCRVMRSVRLAVRLCRPCS